MAVVDKNSTTGNTIHIPQATHTDPRPHRRDINTTRTVIRRETMENQVRIPPPDIKEKSTKPRHQSMTTPQELTTRGYESTTQGQMSLTEIVAGMLHNFKKNTLVGTVPTSPQPQATTEIISNWFTDTLGMTDQNQVNEFTHRAIQDFKLSSAREVEAQFTPWDSPTEKTDEWEKIRCRTTRQHHTQYTRPQEKNTKHPGSNYYTPLLDEDPHLPNHEALPQYTHERILNQPTPMIGHAASNARHDTKKKNV